MKIFSHKFCVLFYFSENPHILPLFLFFIFKSSQQNRAIASPKIFYICLLTFSFQFYFLFIFFILRATAFFPIHPVKTFAPRHTSIYSPFRAQQHKNFSFFQSLRNAEYYPTTRLTISQFHFSISISFLSFFHLRPNCNKKHITTPIASAKHTFYLYFLSVNRATNSFQFLFYSHRRHKNKNIFFTYLPYPTRNTK